MERLRTRGWWIAATALMALWAASAGADDKGFEYEIGGRLMNDWTFASADPTLVEDAGSFDDGVEFRRARVFWRGKFYDRLEFKVQIDFADQTHELKDVYIALNDLPGVGQLRIGHFLEPFTLEIATSSRFITFVERSLTTAFSPGRNTGVMVHDSPLDKRIQWSLGLFRQTNDIGSNAPLDEEDRGGGDDFNVTGRLSGTPFKSPDGRRVLHLGAGLVLQDRDHQGVRFRSRPEASFVPRVVDTGRLPATGADVLGLEAALVRDAFSLQAEHVIADVDMPGSPTLSGSYVYASYFLTGENRPYSASKGGFSRVRPKSDFLSGAGHRKGAWELVGRYSTIDLDDGPVTGGQLDDLTLGVNWYLNPRTRVMLNYVQADVQGVGDAEIVVMRFQVDF